MPGNFLTGNVKCQYVNVENVKFQKFRLKMYKFHKIIRSSIIGFCNVNHGYVPKLSSIRPFKRSNYAPIKLDESHSSKEDTPKIENLTKNIAIALSILTWLGFREEDENKESELIMTLKRSILCTQREQYDKAEQMLHLALRLAQQQQNKQGVLYCYDLMANLAFDTFELDKAEKLFVSVLQMLLSEGMQDDNLKVCKGIFLLWWH